VPIDLDELITIDEPADLTACSLAELRVVRDHYQDVEHGLSYARRIMQGRLDTLASEIERRRDGLVEGDLIQRLPDALSSHTRGPGLPRPIRDLEPPAWADELLEQLAHSHPSTDLEQLDGADLTLATADAASVERDLSEARQEMHRRIDRIQDEIVGRYRNGASVDDLLS
jgi:hypothetical protein